MKLKGFLGTGADFMMDVVIVSLVIILPALYVSLKKALNGDYSGHKRIQTSLFVLLTVAVTLFEIETRMAGGIFAIAEKSRFYGTLLLYATIYIHLFFSISTAIIWIVLVYYSVKKFPNPPKPGPFSKHHRFWGKIGMMNMVFTAITGVLLYLEIFVL